MKIDKNITNKMLGLMHYIGKQKKLSGKDKKKWVMKELEKTITFDNEIEELILFIIDLLIQVENDKLVFNKNVKKICCF